MSLECIPGTPAWRRAKFTPKVELRLRDELRKLERGADARVTVLWLPRDDRGELIAFSGDIHAVPLRFGFMDTTVPSRETLVLEDGEPVDAIVHVVQLGQGLPRLRVAAIAPGPAESTALFELIERCAARLEQIAVGAM